MKRLTLVALSLIFATSVAIAQTHQHMKGQKSAKTVTGEIVDMGCYLGHAARGEKHISCATKCLNQGMPMGVLTSKGSLYLVTLDHDDADPYNRLKTMAGKNVAVTGELQSRNGMNAIVATSVSPAR